MEWRNRIIGYDTKPASQFTPNPSNWRVHPSIQREALRGLLGDVGWVGAVLENKQTGNLIDGHARIEEALNQDSNTLIPYLLVDLSPDEEKLVLASFDPISALATSDKDKLESLLKEVSASSEAVDSLLSEIAKKNGVLLDGDPKDAEPQVDKAAELQQKWGTETGQLWVIGNHRLLVGDSTDKRDVSYLGANGRVSVTVTDPPYNVGIDYGETTDDSKGREAYREWCSKWIAHLPPKRIFTVGIKRLFWWDEIAGMPQWVIAWVKRNGQGNNGMGGTNKWDAILVYGVGIDNDVDVIEVSNDYSEGIKAGGSHPTAKPVQLWGKLLDRFSLPSEGVYEPFAGSGTALVAAENLNKEMLRDGNLPRIRSSMS